MKIREIQEKILHLKKEKDFCILAHSYQASEIAEVTDFTGDSYALSVKAKDVPQKNILMCGVRFMAETVKILSPEKRVFLSNGIAGCPMAEQMDKELIHQVKMKYPEYMVVAYINTTAELKTVCDVCVTSSSAVKIVSKLNNRKILFIPDCNLGAYVQSQLPEKKIKLLKGGCPIHAAVTEKDVSKAKAAHPNALLLVHPECRPAVCEKADYIGSTSGIVQYAMHSPARKFLIGTEISIAETLQNACPEKRFYTLSKKLICENMKATTLMDVYHCLNDDEGAEICLDSSTVSKARMCIDRMIALGG
ncbi:MAG: quinolinate synthase NadA [Ruminococcus sp.]|nr:quinolinate synthase NadA [Ruminococcus sp.]